MIKISSLLFVMVAMMLSACDDYLDDVPKGQKIPKTWEDYNAFIRNNFSYHFLDPDQLAVLAGDIFKLPSVCIPFDLRTKTFSFYYFPVFCINTKAITNGKPSGTAHTIIVTAIATAFTIPTKIVPKSSFKYAEIPPANII